MTAAIYIRVSTDGQDTANQEPDCVRICRARRWRYSIVPEVESGARERPRWRHVLELARSGAIGAVVIWSIDRIGRRMHEVVSDVRELARVGCAVVSVREPWLDTTHPTRDLLLAIFAWVAEHERTRLLERTHAGIARARARGTRIGRPPALPPLALVRIGELRASGRTLGEIQSALTAEGWPRYAVTTLWRAFSKPPPSPAGQRPRNGARSPTRH